MSDLNENDTLRDGIAIQAMEALIRDGATHNFLATPAKIAREAYEIAEAMLREKDARKTSRR